MPYLEDITYSRDECIAAVRDYYHFLTKMYIDESAVIEPPEGGWPTITPHSLRGLGKTDEVISLLRHLPYIGHPNDDDRRHGAPSLVFADWQLDAHQASFEEPEETAAMLRSTSEGARASPHVPDTVVGLTSGGRSNQVLLLDTNHGVIYWPFCPEEVRWNPPRPQLRDDPYDWAPVKEAEWRSEGSAWAIADFFEVFKDEFRKLHFIPISGWTVLDIYTTYGGETEGMIPMLQDIYREHGWPDLERYRKRDCLRAVQKALEERYPFRVDSRGSEDE